MRVLKIKFENLEIWKWNFFKNKIGILEILDFFFLRMKALN